MENLIKGVTDVFSEPIEKGIAKIQPFSISEKNALMYNIRNKMDMLPSFYNLQSGDYIKLYVNNELVMSDTPMERRTNFDLIYKCNGRVLIGGLGIGLLLKNILDKESVTEVIVIEKYQDVIDLVAPKFTHPKLKIICADIFEWIPEKNEKFDTIYFDIWAEVSQDNLKQMKILHNKFRKHLNKLNPKIFMDSWTKGYLIKQRRKIKREEKKEEAFLDSIGFGKTKSLSLNNALDIFNENGIAL